MKNIFKPRARLLLQLGDQLIRNENIALVELVKNSYDADAKNCEVILKNIDNKEEAEILINDDGVGMTPEIIENVWLEPGADIKELVLNNEQLALEFDYTAKRLPIGEKGIGRFGVHKLGNYIELVTKSLKSDKEVVVKIDWDEFKNVKYLEEANFNVEQRRPQVFKNGRTGTNITIRKVKTIWTDKLYKDLHRSLTSLSSPFSQNYSFEIKLKLELKDKNKQENWQVNLLTVKDIKDKALWKLTCTISGKEITEFLYEFKPWKTMDKLNPRIINNESPEYQKVIKKLGNKNESVNLNLYKIGKIKIEAYIFDLSPRILNYGVQDKQGLIDFLSQNGGVRVYRDGMRVYNYGEPEDDWLNLDKTRINQPSQKIGNKNILAAVQLDRKDSVALREQTNREGFVDDEAYRTFKSAVQRAIECFGQLRNIDKKNIRILYEGTSKTQPVLHDIDELKDSVQFKLDQLKNEEIDEKEFINYKEELKKDVFNGLDRIKDQYIKTNSVLLRSANAGLSLGVVIHEIEKRIKELTKVLESEDDNYDINKIRTLVKSIGRLVDNYTVLISSEKKNNLDLKTIIQDAIDNTEFRFKAHKVHVITAFSKKYPVKIECSLNTIVGVLLNIFDNSIYWLNFYEVTDKKIYIDFRKYDNESVGVIIADNGKGFAIASEDAIQPFVSMKPGGMGLGLHIASEMMKIYDGKLVIHDYIETSGIPPEFSEGGIVELIFKQKI